MRGDSGKWQGTNRLHLRRLLSHLDPLRPARFIFHIFTINKLNFDIAGPFIILSYIR